MVVKGLKINFQTIVSAAAIFCTLLFNSLYAAPTVYEAEAGTLVGVSVATSTAGYTGAGYVSSLDNNGDKVTVTISVAQAGIYKLTIRYNSPFGDKIQDLYINGAFSSNLTFTGTSGFSVKDAGGIYFDVGLNTISIQKNWGYTDIDHFGVELIPRHTYNIVPDLVNPDADIKTKAVYNFMRSKFGQCILSGQTDHWNELIAVAGATPAVRGFDMQNYSPMNPWGWNGGPAWGAWDDGTVQKAIDWYNSTNGKGIVTFQWHWFSPSGGTLRTSTFYSYGTTFDVSKAVVPGNQEYTDVIRDIDAIAIQLKRLQTAGVPVLWRPLHEAGGAWFWWGTKGPIPTIALYNIMYDRLTNFHQLNNLIWVWATPEPDWYPGNSKVDIIGYDSYPGAYNYGTQKSVFDQLYTIVGGQKLIALTENGPIPDIERCFIEDAPWAYFASWVDLVTQQNSNQHIVDSYNAACNLDDISLPVTWSSFEAERQDLSVLLNWATVSEKNSSHFFIERSIDGVKFSEIGSVKAVGNSSNSIHYTFSDHRPIAGLLYYRIRQTDMDGSFSYSAIVSVPDIQMGLMVLPNPTEGEFSLIGLPHEEDGFLIIYSSAGQTVLSETIEGNSGSPYKIVSLEKQPQGLYFVQIILKQKKITLPLVKQ